MKKDKFQKEIDENYLWFNKNRKKLIKEKSEKLNYYVLIKNKKIINYYLTIEEALIDANQKFNEKEPYSIQQLEAKETINSLGFIGLK